MTVGKEGAPAVALAHRGDFTLANATIRPSTRTIEGPGGSLTVEPKIMQVLLVFADANRSVITREDLIRACWGGRIVGDDAVNRTIAELRRVARQTGADFSIETIPRIGYRLDRGVGGDAPAMTRRSPREGFSPPALPAPRWQAPAAWWCGGGRRKSPRRRTP